MILLGTSSGRVHFLSRGGELLASHIAGSAPILESGSNSNRLVAAYGAGVLRLFEGISSVGTAQIPEYSVALAALSSNVLVWSWNRAWLVSCRGETVRSTTFPLRIGGAVVDERGFSILAGSLLRYQLK
jgi:hypothetical protein